MKKPLHDGKGCVPMTKKYDRDEILNAGSKTSHASTASGNQSGAPLYQLRSTPKTVPKDRFKKEFGLNDHDQPIRYIQNDYKKNGDGTVTDRTTGLMWQQSGSEEPMCCGEVASYLNGLNQSRFAGYSDWRLPTIPELMSLLDSSKKNGMLYIDAVFGKQCWCWSSDSRDSNMAWGVDFIFGEVVWVTHNFDFWVRALRSGK
jgi:serine/threonine-protein kinase